MMRKICVITGSRSEYGLLRWLMKDIREDSNFTLQIIVTGMHLSPEFGLTYHEIEADGFEINRKVELQLSSDTEIGIAKSMGLGMIGFADALSDLKPSLIIVLGDRFEIFSAVSAALVMQIPVAHIHGGEITEGAFDDALRHSITKMSHLHFVAAGEYRRRVIQLGEQPDRVFVVGGLGVDSIKRTELLNREELEKTLGIKFGPRNLLITFHPTTLEGQNSKNYMEELLAALKEFVDINLIFTMPNADTGGRELASMIMNFIRVHPNAYAFSSLGRLHYLSCLQFIDGVVGNSSSGLAEAPSMGIGTINIGNRQQGRLSATSVINCQPTFDDICSAIKKIYDPLFRSTLPAVNPYGNGGACKKIIELLRNHTFDNLIKKSFYDQLMPKIID